MVRRTEPRGRRAGGGSADTEWVGGTTSMRAYVTGEGEPYRPEALIWMGPEGTILGSTIGQPGQLLGMACESLQSTIVQPMCGSPHAPTRLRVASAELAGALRVGHPEVEVVCAPTPELDEVFALMGEALGRGDDPSYLSADIAPDAVASFFRSAAELFRARPWKVVPSDQDLFSVTIEELGLLDAVVSVIGQMGESRGIVLLADVADFEAFVDAAGAIGHGEEPELPPHAFLNFESGTNLPVEMLREVGKHDWEVAKADAYPWLVVVDGDLVMRPPTVAEMTLFEALALALAAVLAEKRVLRAAWEGGEPVSRTVSVRAHAGEIDVTLRAPYERSGRRKRPPSDLLGELFDLAQDVDEIDYDERNRLEDELLRRFADSSEADGATDVEACRIVTDYAADYFGATVATLDASDLREIVFGIIPRKVVLEASEAGSLIKDFLAFYMFLKREFGLEQADACLRVLGGSAVSKLEAALSDRRNFGMAKSHVVAGRDAGFEVDTEEGLEAWFRFSQGRPLPPAVGGPSPLPAAGRLMHDAQRQDVSKSARQAKKNKRKAARKARRKNR